MNDDLKAEYRDVRFRCSVQDMPPNFFVITSHNPDGKTVHDETNKDANRQLAKAVSDLIFPLIRVTGGSKPESTPNPTPTTTG